MRTRTSGGVGGAGVSPAPTRSIMLRDAAARRRPAPTPLQVPAVKKPNPPHDPQGISDPARAARTPRGTGPMDAERSEAPKRVRGALRSR